MPLKNICWLSSLVTISIIQLSLQEASDPQPITVDEKAERYRGALDKAIQSYVKDHYPSGVVVVSFELAVVWRGRSVCLEFAYTQEAADMYPCH